MSGKSKHPDPVGRAEHMSRRRGQGLTVRQLADEFNMSKTHAHHITDRERKKADDILRHGYKREPIK